MVLDTGDTPSPVCDWPLSIAQVRLSCSKCWSSVCPVITESEPGSEQRVGKSLGYALGSVPFGFVSIECNPGFEQVSSFGFPQVELLRVTELSPDFCPMESTTLLLRLSIGSKPQTIAA